jgi:putative RNA 2'-phosphotransferase
MNKNLVTSSKFLSLVLRHKPGTIGLTLDASGWVGVDELLAACRAHGQPISRAKLDEIVATNDKKRFAFSDDGTRIRASQGHSVDVELGYEPATPPETLYHGAPHQFVEAIRAEGLKKMKRHHVHLSEDVNTTMAVAMRRGRPVLLTIRTGDMHRGGIEFFRSANGVWLTEHVPPEYIEFPD